MRVRFFFATTLLVAAAASLSAQPFVGWRGPNRDGVYPASGLQAAWPQGGPQLLWEADNLGNGYSSPTIVGDKLYVTGLNADGTREVFSAYSLTDGKQIFQSEYGNAWTDSYSYSRCTPTIVDGKAYLVSGMGEVVCLSVADGKKLWVVEGKTFGGEMGRWGAAESPLVFDGKVIFSPAGKQTAVVAVDPQTGTTIWQSRSLNHRGAYVSPQLVQHNGKKQIIGLDGQCVYGINPSNGEVMWTFEDYPVGKKENYKICVNTPLFKDGKIYVSNGYNLGSFLLQLADNLDTVSLVWRNEDLDTHIGGQVLLNGTIYGSGWLNNAKGNWVAVDWNTGQTTYNTDWGGGRTKGSIATADGKLFIYDEKRGTVGLLNATPDKFDVVSEFQIKRGEGPHWAHPVIADGVLYIRHGSYLMAYKIR